MTQPFLVGLASCALILASCGGGGGGGSTPTSSLLSPASVLGTVPGTRIEAFGDNGSYYVISSTHNGTGEHPFQLDLPPGIGFRIVMITNEGTPEEVVTPIAFRDSSGRVLSRLAVNSGERIDLDDPLGPRVGNENVARQHGQEPPRLERFDVRPQVMFTRQQGPPAAVSTCMRPDPPAAQAADRAPERNDRRALRSGSRGCDLRCYGRPRWRFRTCCRCRSRCDADGGCSFSRCPCNENSSLVPPQLPGRRALPRGRVPELQVNLA